jgi:phage gpG-like protein
MAGRRRIELLIRTLADIQPPLRVFGGYLRAKFKDRFTAEGPGWPPLAQTTGHRLLQTYTGRVTKAGKLRESQRLKRLRRQLQRDVRKERLDARVLVAFERATRSTGGGALGEAVRQHAAGHRYARELSNLAKALDRAHAGKRRKQRRAITKHQHLLGRLGSTIKARLSGNAIVVGSFVPWAGVHNEGGPAGHGAVIPKRTFAELESDDVDVLVKILVARAIGVADAGL